MDAKFNYLRKKIDAIAEYSLKVIDDEYLCEIHCLGFSYKLYNYKPIKKINSYTKKVLIEYLVGNENFLKKLEEFETRNKNLKTLLD